MQNDIVKASKEFGSYRREHTATTASISWNSELLSQTGKSMFTQKLGRDYSWHLTF